MRPLRSKLPDLYGEIIDGVWASEGNHMAMLVVHPDIAQVIKRNRIYCNKDISIELNRGFLNILARGLLNELKTFDGCFCIRQSRSDIRPSVHSWGLAIDLNAETNKLGEQGDISPQLVRCFTDEGFVWGGDWDNKDPMHLQYVTED